MSLDPPSGFAIRRDGTCDENETKCGNTGNSFVSCCPDEAICYGWHNSNCCTGNQNCTLTLIESPTCANDTWTLYLNGGYFCCAPDTIGYANSGTDGCAEAGSTLPSGATVLVSHSTDQNTTTSQSSTTSTPVSTSSPSSSLSISIPDVNDSTDVGAIAGGVVGGVAGVVLLGIACYLVFRRRQMGDKLYRRDGANDIPDSLGTAGISKGEYSASRELDANSLAPQELYGQARCEMPGSENNGAQCRPTAELP